MAAGSFSTTACPVSHRYSPTRFGFRTVSRHPRSAARPCTWMARRICPLPPPLRPPTNTEPSTGLVGVPHHRLFVGPDPEVDLIELGSGRRCWLWRPIRSSGTWCMRGRRVRRTVIRMALSDNGDGCQKLVPAL